MELRDLVCECEECKITNMEHQNHKTIKLSSDRNYYMSCEDTSLCPVCNPPKPEFKVLCPYCDAPFTAKMTNDLNYSEGSYTPDCVLDKIYGNIDIICSNCSKLVYRKEVEVRLEEHSDNRWNR